MEINQTLPQLLKQKRLAADLSIEKVEELTNVAEEYIKYLESGLYYKLPAFVYTRGYLKSLANLYKLEPSLLYEKYQEESGSTHEKLNSDKIKPSPLSAQKFIFTHKKIAGLVFASLVVSIAGYMIWQISHITAPPKLMVSSPIDGQHIAEGSVTVSGQTEPGAIVFINQQPVPTDADGAFLKSVYVHDGENQIVVRAENRFNRFREVKKRIVVSTTQAGVNENPQVLGEQTQK